VRVYVSQLELISSLAEKLKMEFDANTILLKHDIMGKTEALDKLTKEHQKQSEAFKELQHQLQEINAAVRTLVMLYIIFIFIFYIFPPCSMSSFRMNLRSYRSSTALWKRPTAMSC